MEAMAACTSALQRVDGDACCFCAVGGCGCANHCCRFELLQQPGADWLPSLCPTSVRPNALLRDALATAAHLLLHDRATAPQAD